MTDYEVRLIRKKADDTVYVVNISSQNIYTAEYDALRKLAKEANISYESAKREYKARLIKVIPTLNNIRAEKQMSLFQGLLKLIETIKVLDENAGDHLDLPTIDEMQKYLKKYEQIKEYYKGYTNFIMKKIDAIYEEYQDGF